MNDKPYLGRCKEKGCDYALFASPDQIKTAEGLNDVKAGTGPYCCGNYGVFARCSNRHKVFSLKQIKGTYGKDHKCDSRCLNAKGHDCTCSCGGLNHGRGHAVETQPYIVATSIANEVRMISEPQSRFIRNLLDEREIPSNDNQTGAERRTRALEVLETMTMTQAKKTIDWLLTLERIANV